MATKIICRLLGFLFIIWLSLFLSASTSLMIIFFLSSGVGLAIHRLQNINLMLVVVAMLLVVLLHLWSNSRWLEYQWPLFSLILVLSLGQAVIMVTNHYVYQD